MPNGCPAGPVQVTPRGRPVIRRAAGFADLQAPIPCRDAGPCASAHPTNPGRPTAHHPAARRRRVAAGE